MKVVRIILYILGGLFLALIGLGIYVVNFVPDPGPSRIGFAQSMTVGGKTVQIELPVWANYRLGEATGEDE